MITKDTAKKLINTIALTLPLLLIGGAALTG